RLLPIGKECGLGENRRHRAQSRHHARQDPRTRKNHQNAYRKATMKTLDINQIKEFLPHRYPLLLVDRVLDWEAGKTITAIKNVTANEEFFNGHFPHKPV